MESGLSEIAGRTGSETDPKRSRSALVFGTGRSKLGLLLRFFSVSVGLEGEEEDGADQLHRDGRGGDGGRAPPPQRRQAVRRHLSPQRPPHPPVARRRVRLRRQVNKNNFWNLIRIVTLHQFLLIISNNRVASALPLNIEVMPWGNFCGNIHL